MALPVCAACGVLAPDDRALCTLCAEPFPEPRPEAPSPTGDRRWVCVRTRFHCNACAQISPVRGFSDDDTLTCVHCGQRQGFPDAELRDVLEIAHATVDPELRDFDVFDRLEGKATFIDYARDKLSILAAPGHPRCARCHAFVQLGTADGRTSELSCECGPQAHHVPGVLARRLPELRGVYSDETRTDVPRATAASAGGATAFLCALCGGAFGASEIGTGPIVPCRYCKAANRVEVALGAKADPVWLLVEGASRKRLDHEAKAAARERRKPDALTELVAAIRAPAGKADPVSQGWLLQLGVVVMSGVIVFGAAGWNEVFSFAEYRARAAMLETKCTIERIKDERHGEKTVRTHFGTAIDPRTGQRHVVRAVGEDSHTLWAAGAGKSSTEEILTQTKGIGFPATLTCFLDPQRDRVVFNRPGTFSPIPMVLLVIGFLASLAGGFVMARRALRAKPSRGG